MRRRWLALVALSAAGTFLVANTPASAGPADDDAPPGPSAPNDAVELVLFHGDGCPHCARMIDFLDDLVDEYPDLVVDSYEVWYDPGNQQVFVDTMAAHGEEAGPVPAVIVGDRVFVGYSDAIARNIEDVVAALSSGSEPVTVNEFVVDVPLLGEVDVGSKSLLGATIVIAFVDGVNPCSLWVLSMLLALVVHSGSRTRVLMVGGLFLTITSLLYGLYMLGAYSVLSIVGRLDWIRAGVALVAGVFGILHLKEHWTSRGPSVTISADAKPGIFRRMRRLADMEQSLPATLGGTAVLAVGVSLLETPCTAGLPLLWADLLAAHDVGFAAAAFLFGVYLLVFLADELLIFGAVVVTMRATKMQEEHGQALQLIGGTLMLTLAGAMVFAPDLLESVGGTVLVFGVAAGFTLAVLGIEWLVDRHGDRRHGHVVGH